MGVCANPKCKNAACYNYEGRQAIMCEHHKFDGMIIIKKQKCIHTKCCRNARFNIPNEKSVIYCIDHKLPDMIDIENTLYDYDNFQGILDKTNKIIYEFNNQSNNFDLSLQRKIDKKRALSERKDTCFKDGCDKTPKFNAHIN